MSNKVNTPGKGLLIAAGVILIIAGVVGAIGAYGLMQAPPLMRVVSPFIFGLSWSTIYRVLLVSSFAYVGLGIEALVYCGKPDKAKMLMIIGYVLLGWAILSTIFITRHIGFTFLIILDYGVVIMYIAGATMNVNASQKVSLLQGATFVPEGGGFCPQCGHKLFDSDNAAFCPGCGTKTIFSQPTIGVDNECIKCKKSYSPEHMACPFCKFCPNPMKGYIKCSKCGSFDDSNAQSCFYCGLSRTKCNRCDQFYDNDMWGCVSCGLPRNWICKKCSTDNLGSSYFCKKCRRGKG